MWKLIFSTVTNRGTGCNREPFDGEFAVDLSPSECAWFNVYPERYQYVEGVFSESSDWADEQHEAALTQVKEEADTTIRALGSAQLLMVGKPYSVEERETWATQESEARAWTANHSASCPMIANMAATRGIPIALMVAKIIENSDLFKVVVGKILGEQQKALDLL